MGVDVAKCARALGDPTRISIIRLLAGYSKEPVGSAGRQTAKACDTDVCGGLPGEVCVCEIEAALRISQPRTSYHLRILREAGLVNECPHGRWKYYSVDTQALARFCKEVAELGGVSGKNSPTLVSEGDCI